MSKDLITMSRSAAERWRDVPLARDEKSLATLLAATEMFDEHEIQIARSLLIAPPIEGYRFIFVDYDGQLAGFACYGAIPGTEASFDLYWLAVNPSMQRRGYGSRLMEAVEARVREAGGTRIYVDTSARAQYKPTRAFYRAQGYRVVAELPGFYRPGEAKVIFCKLIVLPA